MTMATRDTATVTGQYQSEYETIVKPERYFLIPNYFINYWVSRLGPTCAWMVISLKQASWGADNSPITISQATIAEEIGLERRSVGRVLKKNPYRHWFIPEITYQKGKFDQHSQTYCPLPNQYQINLSTPLIPEHLAGLYVYLRNVGQADEVEGAVERLLAMRPKEALAMLEELALGADRPFDRPLSPAAVAELATGIKLTGPRANQASGLLTKLNQLNSYLTNTGKTLCRQYFRESWVPELGPSMAWLVLVLRSRCYYNPQTGELRDVYTWSKKELREMLGQSKSSLQRQLDHPYADQFFEVLENGKHLLTIRTEMIYEPLIPAIEADLNELSRPQNDPKCDITP